MRFKTGSNILLALTVAFGVGSALNADTVNGGSWTTWTQSNLYGYNGAGANYQAYYWNNFSADGSSNAAMNQANIGWTLTTGGTYNNAALTPLSNPPGALPFLSNGTAAGSTPATSPMGNQEATGNDAPTNISLTQTGLASEAYLRDSITGVKGGSPGILYFGYYLTNGNGTPNMSTMTQLFSSTSAIGTSAGINIPAGSTYGFYVQNVQGQGTAAQTTFTFFSDAASNSNTGAENIGTEQQFALFNGSGSTGTSTDTYWVGAFGQPSCVAASGQGYTPENSPCAQGYAFDYNDFVVEVMPAPEPTTMALMGSGLILAGLFFRRRFAVKS